MDFSYTEDQRAFIDSARQFAEQELEPFAAEWDEQETFPRETLRRAGEMGFLALYTPEHVGGMGLGRLDASLIFEQLAAGCTTTTAFMTIHNMATWMVGCFASVATRHRWMEALISGDALASYCLTEPGAGSDAANLQTRATRTETGYRLEGTKVFISGAGATDLLVVMARTGGRGPKGITAFAIPADSPGISYGRKEPKMGWHAQPTRSVTFEAVDVPESCRMGEEGEGFTLAMKGLDGGRINIATCSIGTAQRALEKARSYLLERHQFGRPLADFQALQFKLADMATELEAARQLVRLAAWKLDQQAADRTLSCAMAKRLATDIGYRVCDEALQIHGGYGYIREYPLERYVRDVRVHQILEGTNEIMRLIIARQLLAQDGL